MILILFVDHEKINYHVWFFQMKRFKFFKSLPITNVSISIPKNVDVSILENIYSPIPKNVGVPISKNIHSPISENVDIPISENNHISQTQFQHGLNIFLRNMQPCFVFYNPKGVMGQNTFNVGGFRKFDGLFDVIYWKGYNFNI